jgi:hypothetical protein
MGRKRIKSRFWNKIMIFGYNKLWRWRVEDGPRERSLCVAFALREEGRISVFRRRCYCDLL